MIGHWSVFVELIRAPFQQMEWIWGIVPLYFGLLVNELTSSKANFRTAIQTGFSFLWAGAHWLYPYFSTHGAGGPHLELNAMTPVNLTVTTTVLVLGALAIVCGLRKRFFQYTNFLGHSRFANYFMIAIFPLQAHCLPWTWPRLIAIGLFAVPVWLVLQFGLMPVRGK